MSSDEQVAQSWSCEYNRIRQMYEDGLMAGCVESTQDLLDDPDQPRYHRIKTLILLAYSLAEWTDMHNCSEEAERLYMVAKDYYPEVLDALKKLLLDEMPGGGDEEWEKEEGEEGAEEGEETLLGTTEVEIKQDPEEPVKTMTNGVEGVSIAAGAPEGPDTAEGATSVAGEAAKMLKTTARAAEGVTGE
ncbi:uncharacterized protein LTR77_002314 [Saxophila tyrrhenica]|uniref:Uncharacterized protein n=1 Tax=Saxophila tyrrhenica TaxID=1690608 RepID=A0AAV9PN19_9PEZI|nr:hypothetical protein LTR77_002314 [Saxophila tyrrhenica]